VEEEFPAASQAKSNSAGLNIHPQMPFQRPPSMQSHRTMTPSGPGGKANPHAARFQGPGPNPSGYGYPQQSLGPGTPKGGSASMSMGNRLPPGMQVNGHMPGTPHFRPPMNGMAGGYVGPVGLGQYAGPGYRGGMPTHLPNGQSPRLPFKQPNGR